MTISKARKQEIAEAILEIYKDPWKWVKEIRDFVEGSTSPQELAVQIRLVQEDLRHYEGFHAAQWEIKASLPTLHAIYGFMLLGRKLNE